MTDQQIQQSMQDNITLDYSKWSAERRNAKLSTDHDLWLKERDAVIARRQRDNESARQAHLNQIASDRSAKEAERDAEIEKELIPHKIRLQNQWLADHPGQTTADFESKAWGNLKANLLEERRELMMQAEITSAQASGRYSL